VSSHHRVIANGTAIGIETTESTTKFLHKANPSIRQFLLLTTLQASYVQWVNLGCLPDAPKPLSSPPPQQDRETKLDGKVHGFIRTGISLTNDHQRQNKL